MGVIRVLSDNNAFYKWAFVCMAQNKVSIFVGVVMTYSWSTGHKLILSIHLCIYKCC